MSTIDFCIWWWYSVGILTGARITTMALTKDQVFDRCKDLSVDEIQTRVDQLIKVGNGGTTLEFYSEHLAIAKAAEESKPLDLMVAEYWIKLRTSALRRNKEFNLTFGDVKRLVTRKKCAYTGYVFSGILDRTVDRLDASKGYIKGNVFAVSKEANSAKNMLFESEASKTRLTIPQLESMIQFIKDNM